MMRIDLFKAYWDAMAIRVEASRAMLVRDESELAQKIKQVEGAELILVTVIPSADSAAMNTDNILEREMVIVYALKKVSHRDQDDADILADMLQTQECITRVKQNLLADAIDCDADYHEYISRVDFGKIHTDPEYNYLGCDGYSISFQLNSPGF